MAKFYGAIGFAIPTLVERGVVRDEISERMYRGDIQSQSRRWQPGETLTDELTCSMRLSIVADNFANIHLGQIRYVKYGGTAWEVNTVEVARPRLVLSVGGVYNGPQAQTAGDT